MKQKIFYWFIIISITLLTIFLDYFADGLGRQFPFIWSIDLLPVILMMHLYPKWKVMVGSTIFYNLIEVIVELNQERHLVPMDIAALIGGSIINWSILSTVGYFRFQNEKLLLKLEEMTVTDSLTGLNNRRYFDLMIEKAIPLSKETNYPLLLIMIDIDHFKMINDCYGHICGDTALRHVANIIKNNIRELDVLSRIGGEEFAILLPGTRLVEAVSIAEQVRHAVEHSIFSYEKKTIPITISLGLAIYHAEEIEKFIKKADKALYQAKENGRNRLVVTTYP